MCPVFLLDDQSYLFSCPVRQHIIVMLSFCPFQLIVSNYAAIFSIQNYTLRLYLEFDVTYFCVYPFQMIVFVHVSRILWKFFINIEHREELQIYNVIRNYFVDMRLYSTLIHVDLSYKGFIDAWEVLEKCLISVSKMQGHW